MINFDTALYERPIRAPIVDTFQLGDAAVTADSLRDKWVPAANRRHNKGEHSTLVIGHTRDNMTREEDQPTVVGVLTGPFAYHDSYPGVDGPCMSGLHWISKERTVPCDGVPLKLSAKEILDRWPRRSAELWFSDYKIDPHCLLGATTPCRELGPLRLSSNGGLIVTREIGAPLKLSNPQESRIVADETKEPKDDDKSGKSKDTGVQKQLEALTQEVMSLKEAVATILQQGAGGAAAGAAGGAPGAGGHSPEDDEELEKLLAQLHGGGEGGAGGEPQPEPEPKPAPKKLSATEDAEKTELRVRLRRMEIKDDLRAISAALADDAALIEDLGIQPPDAYKRQLDRLKLSANSVTAANLTAVVAHANANAAPNLTGKKEIATIEDNEKIVRLCAEKKLTYQVAADQLGYVTRAS